MCARSCPLALWCVPVAQLWVPGDVLSLCTQLHKLHAPCLSVPAFFEPFLHVCLGCMQAFGADIPDYWDLPREDPGMEEWATNRLEQIAEQAAGLHDRIEVQDGSN